MKLVMLIFIWGPALLGFSAGWIIRHPDDWTGPAIIGPVGAIITYLTYRWGMRRLKTLSGEGRLLFIGGMSAGGAVGVVILLMLILRII